MMIRKQWLIAWFFLALFLAACGSQVSLEWDHSPDESIISLSQGGGLVPLASMYNDFPEAQVWGDGRIIWQTSGANHERLVWQGQLSEAEMTGLLQTFADKGFFRLDSYYRPKDEIYDASTTSLQLNLLEDRYHVSEYHSGAPRKFHELVSLMSSGAGAAGAPYAPQSGFLTAAPQNRAADELPLWDTAVGLTLADAEEGVWLEGEALAQAWALVNQKYWWPLAAEGEQVYELYLQIPELTGREPEQP